MNIALHSILPIAGVGIARFPTDFGGGLSFNSMSKKPKSDFWKHYEHPLWQKKRLEILERDKYVCLHCEKSDAQLHIHHAYYVKGRKPWQYPNWSLRALCKDCHAESHLPPEDSDEPERVDHGQYEWEIALSFLVGGGAMDFPLSSALWDIAAQTCMIFNTGHFSRDEILLSILRHVTELRQRVEVAVAESK